MEVIPVVADRNPGLLRVGDVARMLSCSERTVWRLLARQQLTTVRVGRAVRIPLAEVERFIGGEGAR